MTRQGTFRFAFVIAACFAWPGLAPAFALTPLKSPEQLAQDEILFARASRGIEAAAMTCFSRQGARPSRPMTIRFFLSGAGTRVSQLQLREPGSASAAMRRAGFRAIRACTPYAVPHELRNWGGFWATVTLR
jgi:hypothetical protein